MAPSNHGVMQRFQGKIKAKLLLLSTNAISFRNGDTFVQAPNIWTNAGAPTNGGSGTLFGAAEAGDLLVDTTNKKLYQNTNTKASPTWTIFESSGGGIVFSSADALTAHAGGTKALALALTANINTLSVCATALDSVLAPPAAAGGIAVIINNGVAGCAVYGAGTDTINGVATATLFYLPAGATAVFYSTVAGKWSGGLVGVAGATAQAQPSNPTPPANTTTYFMQGLGGAITPKKSGNLLVTISGSIIGSTVTAGDGIDFQISHGTGAAPANAAALAGTQDGNVQRYRNANTAVAADIDAPFSTTAVITGLTPGTAYWLDLAAKSIGTNSSCGLANVSVSAVEI